MSSPDVSKDVEQAKAQAKVLRTLLSGAGHDIKLSLAQEIMAKLNKARNFDTFAAISPKGAPRQFFALVPPEMKHGGESRDGFDREAEHSQYFFLYLDNDLSTGVTSLDECIRIHSERLAMLLEFKRHDVTLINDELTIKGYSRFKTTNREFAWEYGFEAVIDDGDALPDYTYLSDFDKY